MKFRHVLIGIVSTTALLAAIATGASSDSTSKASNGAVVSPASVRAPDEEMVDRLIVKPHVRGTRLSRALQSSDASGLSRHANRELRVFRHMSGGAHVIKLDQPVTLSEARVIAARLMRNDSEVEIAEPDRVMRIETTTPTDPSYNTPANNQWHYFAPSGANKGGANLPNAWDVTTGSATINVAVIDTGYRQHADLATVLQGYDFITSTTVANDGSARDTDAHDPGDNVATNECGAGTSAAASSWHGTHVAGTIAALMNNGVGGTGIAPNVKILPVRVLGKCGGFTSDIVDGMRWAAGISVSGVPANANPAHVLNMSLGASGACSATFQSAVTDVVNAGKVIVVATGNSGAATVAQPANCTGVIAVTAHAIDGDNANYANIGAETTISAPGGGCGTLSSGCTALVSATGLGVYSLVDTGTSAPVGDGYGVKQGTSMAAPHVTGVVALMLSLKPTLTPAEVKSYLQSSARAHPTGTTCTLAANSGKCGAGLLDAEAALNTTLLPSVRLSVGASRVVAPNDSVPLTGTAVASTGRTINSYAWTQLSGSAVTITNANTANASFTAPATGTYSFKLSATDDIGKVGTSTAIVRVNTAPVLTAVSAKTVTVGQPLNFSVAATDVDGDTPIFNSVSLPAGATLSAAGVFNWASPTPVGTYTMTYYASDNDANSAQGSVTITVTGGSGGGGGSMDGETIGALLLAAAGIRWRRSRRKAAR